MAYQFHDKEFTFTQPDGSKFKVKGWGDQHYARFETIDGQTVTLDPVTEFYSIATLSDDGDELEATSIRADDSNNAVASRDLESSSAIRISAESATAKGLEASRMMIGGRRCEKRREKRLQKTLTRGGLQPDGVNLAPPTRGTVGDFIGLCILIDFSDEPATISRQEVDDFCNKNGYSGFGNNGSVNNYFRDNSLDSFNYTNIVTQYYRAKKPKSHYTDRGVVFGSRARALIKEALDHLKATGFDFDSLTTDDEDFVYALNIYYAGSNDNNWKQGLWPHSWHLATKYPLGNGKFFYDYQFTNMSDELTLGTFCHENGHMVCDYPDLYDYGSESNGVGIYCLMCAGNRDEKNPSQISAYLKHISGWSSKAIKMTHGATITLDASMNDFAIFTYNENEYYIVENRVKTGRDGSLPGSGLAIWHVDEFGSNSNEQMEPDQHYELSLEQADNKFELERRRHHIGNQGDLFSEATQTVFSDSTAPNSKWWDGSSSSLEIHDISEANEVMSFKVKLREVEDQSLTSFHQASDVLRIIPDDHLAGITDTLTFTQSHLLTSISVSVDIKHSYRGDLKISLIPPSGDTVILHDRVAANDEGDNIKQSYDEESVPELKALLGQPIKGNWILVVQDLASEDVGTLNGWELTLKGKENEGPIVIAGSLLVEDSPGKKIPDNDPVGIESALAVETNGSLSEIEVMVDITHSYIGDLIISLEAPSGTTVNLHNRTGEGANNLLETYTLENTPDLADFTDAEVAGDWLLKIMDLEGQDVGKLNKWQLSIALND